MCLKPLHIINKSSNIPAVGGFIRLQVPCGKCQECKDQKKKDYYVRTFAEYQDLEPYVNSGQGFCYFDTLTYNNDNLPKWNGIPCFNHEHIKLFLKRLRISLQRKGFDVKNNLRYFICSEFGEITKRPHYHVLFFLRFPIHVLNFYDEVRKAWEYGFNDRKYSKVINGKLKLGAVDRIVNRQNALKYVSGYVVKDDTWLKIFNQKVDDLVAKGAEIDDKVLRSIQPRFFLSKDYGKSFLTDLSAKYHFNRDYFEKHGTIQLPDQSYILQDFKIPDYYRRKIYFNLVEVPLEGLENQPMKDKDGNILYYTRGSRKGQVKYYTKYIWKPNNDFIQYQLDTFGNQIDKLATKYHDIANNIPCSDMYNNSLSMSQYISGTLGKRTYKDLAIYSFMYRGRICCDNNYPRFWVDLVSSLYDDRKIHISPSLDKSDIIRQVKEFDVYTIRDTFSPDFKDFDNILEILDFYDLHERKIKSNLIQKIRLQKLQYKNKFNSY